MLTGHLDMQTSSYGTRSGLKIEIQDSSTSTCTAIEPWELLGVINMLLILHFFHLGCI